MAMSRLRVPLLTVAGLAAAGTVVWYFAKKKDKKLKLQPKGFVRCPEQPVNPEALRIGDYAIIELSSRDGSFQEDTWARVVGTTSTGNIRGLLVGESGEPGEPKPLATNLHGFKLGSQIVFPRNCVIEVYRPSPKPGRILCGHEIPPDVEVKSHAALLELGDYAQLIVIDLQGNLERIWVQVVEFGSEHQVLYGNVFGTPTQAEQHGYGAGDTVAFLRDCVVDVSLDAPPKKLVPQEGQ